MKSAARSAIITTGALVLHDGMMGMTEASDDPQAIDAAHAQRWIDNGVLVGTHRASAAGMKERVARLAHERLPLGARQTPVRR